MNFINREDAGIKLGIFLQNSFQKNDCLVVGLSRGGIIVADKVSEILAIPIDFICVKKVSFPANPEYAVGAVTEFHDVIVNQEAASRMGFNERTLHERIEEKFHEAIQLSKDYRKYHPKLSWEGREVFLVDDGLATGLTMKAAILALKNQKVKKITVVVPVASLDSAQEVKVQVDEFISLLVSDQFSAVGQFYQKFEDPEYEKIINILNKK